MFIKHLEYSCQIYIHARYCSKHIYIYIYRERERERERRDSLNMERKIYIKVIFIIPNCNPGTFLLSVTSDQDVKNLFFKVYAKS